MSEPLFCLSRVFADSGLAREQDWPPCFQEPRNHTWKNKATVSWPYPKPGRLFVYLFSKYDPTKSLKVDLYSCYEDAPESYQVSSSQLPPLLTSHLHVVRVRNEEINVAAVLTPAPDVTQTSAVCLWTPCCTWLFCLLSPFQSTAVPAPTLTV